MSDHQKNNYYTKEVFTIIQLTNEMLQMNSDQVS